MRQIEEFMERNKVAEALRLWVVNDVKRNNNYYVLKPLMDGEPAVIQISLKRRGQLRILPAQSFEKQYNEALMDVKELESANKDLEKSVRDSQKALAKVTAALKEIVAKNKALERELKLFKQNAEQPQEAAPVEDTDS